MENTYKINTFNKYKINTSVGFRHFEGIQKLYKECLKISFANLDKNIIITTDQLLWSFNKWVKASDLKEGDLVENNKVGSVAIIKIENIGVQPVFDIINSDVQHFTTDGFTAHNCSFIGSSKTLIRADLLEGLRAEDPIEVRLNYKLKIFTAPIENHIYILGADPSEGTGNDNSVIQVLDITNPKKILQVATFSDNKTDPYKFSDIIVGLSETYNNAEIVVESNSVGILVTNRIWRDLDCDSLVNISENGKGLGIKATKKTKKLANMIFKRFVENNWFLIVNKDTISELGKYEEQTNGSYKVPEPDHDDQVTSLIYIMYYLESDYNEHSEVYESTEIDKELKEELSFVPLSISSSDIEDDENNDYGYNYDGFDNGLDYLNVF